MAEVDPEALADVAYGIFEHSLNRGLQTQDKYLYALVEGGIDFREELSRIFEKFAHEYPQTCRSDNETIYQYRHNL